METVDKYFNILPGEKLEKGVAAITKFDFIEDKLFNMRQLIDNGGMFMVSPGRYTRLHINGGLMMSDTNMEQTSNRWFIKQAKGRVLIAGLGIGLIIQNLREKIKEGIVTEIIVVEKYQDVIDLVAPTLDGLPITFYCADILNYRPAKEERFDTLYFDIWPDISIDNLPQIRSLHCSFRRYKRDKESYMDSWMADFLRNKRDRERREERANSWWR